MKKIIRFGTQGEIHMPIEKSNQSALISSSLCRKAGMTVAMFAAGGSATATGRVALAGRGYFKVGTEIERRAIAALKGGYDKRYYSETLVRRTFSSGNRYTPNTIGNFFTTIPMRYRGNEAVLNIWNGKLVHYMPKYP